MAHKPITVIDDGDGWFTAEVQLDRWSPVILCCGKSRATALGNLCFRIARSVAR